MSTRPKEVKEILGWSWPVDRIDGVPGLCHLVYSVKRGGYLRAEAACNRNRATSGQVQAAGPPTSAVCQKCADAARKRGLTCAPKMGFARASVAPAGR